MANSNLTNNNEIIFDDIFNKINTNVTQAVKETLTPFISKMKEEKSIYQEIVSVMKKMPEFKKIINENELLVKERDYLLKFGSIKINVHSEQENLADSSTRENDRKDVQEQKTIANEVANASEAELQLEAVEESTNEVAEVVHEEVEQLVVEQLVVEQLLVEQLVVEDIEKSNELVVLVTEQMPVYLEEKKIETVLIKQNKQTITLEITNHKPISNNNEEENIDDKIKQIYLDANLLDSQPQSASSSEAQSEADASEADASEADTSEEAEEHLESDLEELANVEEAEVQPQEQDEEAQSEAEEQEEEAQSEAEEQEEEEEAQSEADEEEEAQSEAEVAQEEANSDSEPEEVFIVDIKDKGQFYTTDEQNGDIYEILVDSNDDIGEKIGKFKNGKAMFF